MTCRHHRLTKHCPICRAASAALRDPANSKREKIKSGKALTQKQALNGRKQPYTERGISRVPCAKCGDPSQTQWQVCANNNRWLGVCPACDVALNRMVLRWFKFPSWKELIDQYRLGKGEWWACQKKK